jgi:hypothetical protein
MPGHLQDFDDFQHAKNRREVVQLLGGAASESDIIVRQTDPDFRLVLIDVFYSARSI